MSLSLWAPRRYTFALALLIAFAGFQEVSAQSITVCDQPGIPISSTLPSVADGIMVVDDFVVADANVQITIPHTFVGDLLVDVLAPDGTQVRLHEGQGASSDNLFVTFDDAGVGNGALPYNCICPMQASGPGAMVDFEDGISSGIWIIFVDDTVPEEEDGVLQEWCVILSDMEPPPPLLPIFDLTCSFSGSGGIEAFWSLPGVYDSINVYLDGALQATLPGDATSFVSDPAAPGPHVLSTEPVLGGDTLAADCCQVTLVHFRRGDCDGDGAFNGLLDGLRALNFQFIPGTAMPACFEACDADGDGIFNGLVDGIRILNTRFIPGTIPPPAPGLSCGPDPDPETSLGCNPTPTCNP